MPWPSTVWTDSGSMWRVFTNLSQDHLDYHADLEDYRSAKARLLDLLKPDGWVVVNRDDPAWEGSLFRPTEPSSSAFDDGPRVGSTLETGLWARIGSSLLPFRVPGSAHSGGRRRLGSISPSWAGSTWRTLSLQRAWPGSRA